MEITRRELGRLAVAAVPVARLMAAKPNSNFDGVQVGVITYSYRSMPGANDAKELLKYIVDSGISAIELLGPAAEIYAGAAAPAGRGGGGGGGGRQPMTPEQQAAQRARAEEIKKWRLSVSMDKYKELRNLYNQAGVTIYAFKLEPNPSMSDEEYEYIFHVADTLAGCGKRVLNPRKRPSSKREINNLRARFGGRKGFFRNLLGANHVTLELSNNLEFTKRLGEFAARRHMRVAYHAHTQATMTAWDAVLEQSMGNAINLDCGHYVAGTSESPIPLIQKRHDRIASMHLKDRQKGTSGGANLPWGQGETPIREILQLMRKEKYTFPASIELEYQIPEGSDAVAETAKCVQFCKNALA